MRAKAETIHRLSIVPPVLAFAVFIVYLLQIRDQPFLRYLVANPLIYEDQARRILDGFPRTQPFFLSPLYPAFMALVYALPSGSRLLLLAFQGVLLALNVGLLGVLCTKLLSRKAALAAMFGMALYWSFYYFAGEILPTTLCLTFMLAGLILFVEKDREGLHPVAIPCLAFAGVIMGVYALPGLRNLGRLLEGMSLPAVPGAYWGSLSMLLVFGPVSAAGLLVFRRVRSLKRHINLLASGIVLGVSMLVWSGVSLVAGLFALSLIGQRGGRLMRIGVFVLGIGVPVAAGITHNHLVSGEIIPITSSFGVNLFIGNNTSSDGMNPFKLGEADEVRIEADKQGLAGAERSAFFRKRAVSFISEEPGRWLALAAKKALMSISRFSIDNNADISERREAWTWLFLPGLHFGIVFPLAMAGIIYGLSTNRRAYLLLLGSAACLAVNVLFFVAERFRLPAAAFLIPLAAAGLLGLYGDLLRRRWRSLVIAVIILVAAAALSNFDYLGLSRLQFPSIIVNKAHVERLSGDFVKARGLIDEALRREPGNAGAYFQLGAMEQAEGDLPSALAHCLTSLERDPFFYASYSRAQTILEQSGISPSYMDSYVAAILDGRDLGDLRRSLIESVASRNPNPGSDF